MSLRDVIIKHINISETKAIIIENLAWSVAGKMFSLLSGLIVGIIVARYLGPASYGLLNYVISYVFLFQTIAMFGLDSIEIREEARRKVDYNIIIGTSFVLRLILGATCMLLSVSTSFLMEADLSTTILVAIYSFTIVFNVFRVIRNYFMAIVENKHVVKNEMLRTTVGIGVKLLLLWAGAPLIWFVTAYMADYILLAGGYVMFYKERVGNLRLWRFDWEYGKLLLKESFPLLLTSTAVIIYQRIDQVMIGQMIDKESVGYFSVASRFVEVIIYIPMMLAQTISPVLIRIREKDHDAYVKKGQQFMNVSLWLTTLVSAVVSLLAYWVVVLTFGKAYLPAVCILQVMAFKGASVALSNTAGSMLVAEGLQRYAILRDFSGCVVCILLNYLLLPHYGVIAASYIAIFSNVFAGYIADAFIPAYRHLFVMQTKALTLGWKDLIHIRQIVSPQRN